MTFHFVNICKGSDRLKKLLLVFMIFVIMLIPVSARAGGGSSSSGGGSSHTSSHHSRRSAGNGSPLAGIMSVGILCGIVMYGKEEKPDKCIMKSKMIYP